MINTIIFKVVAPCNINCSYCYEYNRGDDSWKSKPKRVLIDVIKKVAFRIKEYCSLHKIEKFDVNFHGGEPLMLGEKKLRILFETLLENTSNIKLNLGIQTNGTLINNELLDLFEEFNVAVGLSLDGGRRQNRYRIGHDGKPAFDKIINGLNLLKERKRIFSGLLCVIDLNSNPAEVIQELSNFSPPSIDLLPPFGNFDNPPFGSPYKYSLSDWIIKAFEYWTSSSDLQKIKIRYLEDVLIAILADESRSDWFGIRPPGYIVVATDGNYEGLDTLKVTLTKTARNSELNVFDHNIEAVANSDIIEIRSQGAAGLCDECKRCSIVKWCGGGYLPNRYSTKNGFNNPSYNCRDLKNIFKYMGNWILKQNNIDSSTKETIQEKIKFL